MVIISRLPGLFVAMAKRTKEHLGFLPGIHVPDYKIFDFMIDQIVWAKCQGWPWWPAVVCGHDADFALVTVRFLEWSEELVGLTSDKVKTFSSQPPQPITWIKKREKHVSRHEQALIAAKELEAKYEPPKEKDTLRAGDTIEYYHPFYHREIVSADIVEVYSKQSTRTGLLKVNALAIMEEETEVNKVGFEDWKPLQEYVLIPSYKHKDSDVTRALKKTKKMLSTDPKIKPLLR